MNKRSRFRASAERSGDVVAMAADASARIEAMPTMVAVPIADTAQMKRLIKFASDAAELADRRRDVELRDLIGNLHADLLVLRGNDDG
jgi:hypothetical protein